MNLNPLLIVVRQPIKVTLLVQVIIGDFEYIYIHSQSAEILQKTLYTLFNTPPLSLAIPLFVIIVISKEDFFSSSPAGTLPPPQALLFTFLYGPVPIPDNVLNY